MSEIERLRALLAEGTPGPWRAWGMQLRFSTCPERCADLDHSDVLADFYTERRGHPRTFDLDLTIAAVKALPGLLDVVDAARAYLASDGSGIRAKGRWSAPFDAMDHAHALGRLRKALARLDGAS